MSFLLLLAVQSATLDCESRSDPIEVDQCILARSLDQLPDVDCVNQQTQLELNVCSFRTFLRSDIELNQVWAEAMEKWKDDDHLDDLVNAQRKWIVFRDAQCAFEAGPQEEGGTIWPLIQNRCMDQLTQTRILRLRELVARIP